MNKIDKIEKELEKAREKAAEWQAKIRDLEKQKQEEENSQIVQAVRSQKRLFRFGPEWPEVRGNREGGKRP